MLSKHLLCARRVYLSGIPSAESFPGDSRYWPDTRALFQCWDVSPVSPSSFRVSASGQSEARSCVDFFHPEFEEHRELHDRISSCHQTSDLSCYAGYVMSVHCWWPFWRIDLRPCNLKHSNRYIVGDAGGCGCLFLLFVFPFFLFFSLSLFIVFLLVLHCPFSFIRWRLFCSFDLLHVFNLSFFFFRPHSPDTLV